MRVSLIAASVLAIAATGASAQVTTEFRGLRAEGQIGFDRFQSQGTHNDKFGYGGAVGFDGTINEKFVVGAEGSYWRANDWSQNRTLGDNGGVIRHKSFEEWGVAARAGYLITPGLLAYAKGGYVINEQRKAFDAGPNQTSFNNSFRTTGYQVGGGLEYSPTQFNLPLPVYVNAQYVYSGYNDHTARQRAMLGIGVRFK